MLPITYIGGYPYNYNISGGLGLGRFGVKYAWNWGVFCYLCATGALTVTGGPRFSEGQVA
jgi:hypothetical protein